MYRSFPSALIGKKIRLRIPTPADLAFIRRLWADPETMAPLGGPVGMTDAQMADWFSRMVDPGSGRDIYLLIVGPDNEPVGEVSFHRLDPEKMTADFNIKVAADQRRKGYGAEAMGLLLHYFFVELGGECMIDDLAPDNPVGQAAMADFGFVHDPGEPGVHRMVMTRAMYLSRQR